MRLGLRQSDVAVAAGIRPHTLWRHEAGQHMPHIRTMERLAKAFSALAKQEITLGTIAALGSGQAPHRPTVLSRISKSKRTRKGGKTRQSRGLA